MKFSVGMALLVLLVWMLPVIWCTRDLVDGDSRRLALRTEMPEWKFRPISIGRSAEGVLVADELLNGEFRRDDGVFVRAFAAGRHRDRQNEIGLFVHTPDRCWTSAGWRLDPTAVETAECVVDGFRLPVERRIFERNGERELVYFTGLIGGRPLAYRLDHNRAMGIRASHPSEYDRDLALARIVDKKLWRRAWENFLSRRRLRGRQQFIRVSVPIIDGLTEDATLMGFVAQWLQVLRVERSAKNGPDASLDS